MSVCTGLSINVEPNHCGVKIVTDCPHDACDQMEISLSANEWLALVNQGFKAVNQAGQ